MRRFTAAVGVASACLGVLLAVMLIVPIELRHTAPFGFQQTLDRSRGIAVNGITVTSNYPDFNRVDLDLRAYTPGTNYDFTVLIRPETDKAEPVRVVRIARSYDNIAVDKAALADPFTTVRFDPIEESKGQAYYVSIDRGPRNEDDIVALWSVKSYSRLTGTAALTALVVGVPGDLPHWLTWTILSGFMLLFVLALGALMLALGGWAWREAWTPVRADGTVRRSESMG